MSEAATDRTDLFDRLRVEHRHTPGTTALVVLLAVALAWYASWLTADLGLGTIAFVLVAVVAAYALYRQPTRRGVLVVGLYALAVVLLVTPIFLNLPFLLAAGSYDVSNPTAFTMRLSDVIFVVLFAILAAVPGGLAWRLSTR